MKQVKVLRRFKGFADNPRLGDIVEVTDDVAFLLEGDGCVEVLAEAPPPKAKGKADKIAEPKE